ncbi:MAG TPA: hypothetical protein DGT53_00955 [Dialister sp.]|nr:hypothetical protein [Dialister sp.]
MKKELAALALTCALIPGVSMAADKLPSSEKLMNDYDKYVVVYTSDDERIYADADTIERDPVSAGELPVIRATLYAEIYKDPLTWPDYGNYRMVDYILRYDTAVGADQLGQKIKYRILNKLEGAYTPDGKAVSYPGNPNEPADEAEDIYIALYRVSKTSY